MFHLSFELSNCLPTIHDHRPVRALSRAVRCRHLRCGVHGDLDHGGRAVVDSFVDRPELPLAQLLAERDALATYVPQQRSVPGDPRGRVCVDRLYKELLFTATDEV
jgi:hypothetical protein